MTCFIIYVKKSNNFVEIFININNFYLVYFLLYNLQFEFEIIKNLFEKLDLT